MRHRPRLRVRTGPGALAVLRPETTLAGVSSTTKPSAMDRSVRTDAAPGRRVSDGGGRELYTDSPKLRGDGKPVSREVSEQSREWERENRHAEGKACGFEGRKEREQADVDGSSRLSLGGREPRTAECSGRGARSACLAEGWAHSWGP